MTVAAIAVAAVGGGGGGGGGGAPGGGGAAPRAASSRSGNPCRPRSEARRGPATPAAGPPRAEASPPAHARTRRSRVGPPRDRGRPSTRPECSGANALGRRPVPSAAASGMSPRSRSVDILERYPGIDRGGGRQLSPAESPAEERGVCRWPRSRLRLSMSFARRPGWV